MHKINFLIRLAVAGLAFCLLMVTAGGWTSNQAQAVAQTPASKTSKSVNNLYRVQNQWGTSTSPWNAGGTWLLGHRINQNVVAISIASSDSGNTLNGTMTYAGEGFIAFKAEGVDGGVYDVENQRGKTTDPWNAGGVWVIGNRDKQNVVQVKVTSGDGGKSLNGTMTYAAEGFIGFKGALSIPKTANTYKVENQWGTSSSPWNPGGSWVLGSHNGQNVVAIDVTSKDGGINLQGTMTYKGEGPIGFRAKQR